MTTKPTTYMYICEGIPHELSGRTLEEAETEARAYTHEGWDAYLDAPEKIEYWIYQRVNGADGEKEEYAEVCGPDLA